MEVQEIFKYHDENTLAHDIMKHRLDNLTPVPRYERSRSEVVLRLGFYPCCRSSFSIEQLPKEQATLKDHGACVLRAGSFGKGVGHSRARRLTT